MTDEMWRCYGTINYDDKNAYCDLTDKMCNGGDCRKCVFALVHYLVKELKE